MQYDVCHMHLLALVRYHISSHVMPLYPPLSTRCFYGSLSVVCSMCHAHVQWFVCGRRCPYEPSTPTWWLLKCVWFVAKCAVNVFAFCCFASAVCCECNAILPAKQSVGLRCTLTAILLSISGQPCNRCNSARPNSPSQFVASTVWAVRSIT